MTKLKVVVIDDEPLAVNVLKKYISEIGELELLATFTNAVEASTYVQVQEPDLIFLDINMPLLNGLDFLENLKTNTMTVFTTAHEEYALNGFELEVSDYLVKPIPFPRFLRSVQRIIDLKSASTPSTENEEKNHVYIKVDKKKYLKIYFNDITIIESLKDYIRIKTLHGNYITHRTLSSFTAELPSDKFIRIHRSFTVALDKVEYLEGNSLSVNGKRYTIGRSYIDTVKKEILNLNSPSKEEEE